MSRTGETDRTVELVNSNEKNSQKISSEHRKIHFASTTHRKVRSLTSSPDPHCMQKCISWGNDHNGRRARRVECGSKGR